MAQIDVVLFDLGGVLIDFGGIGAMGELTGIADEAEVARRWLACEAVRSFERGGCGPDEFAAGVVADWGLPIEPAAFLEAFGSWVGDVLPGAAELVAETRAVVPVGCLSNSNVHHWRVADRWPFLEDLDHELLSFRLGLVKPDRAIFDRAAELVGAPPARVLFLDDNVVNVDAARAAGLRAHVTRGPQEARRALVAEGVLPT